MALAWSFDSLDIPSFSAMRCTLRGTVKGFAQIQLAAGTATP